MNKVISTNSKLRKVIKEKALETNEFLIEMDDTLVNDIDTSYTKNTSYATHSKRNKSKSKSSS